MKHKTQVFFSPQNDHICTRIEHVTHVESISYTIAKYLGLNTELTKAIATAHDIGHSPFGHQGEKILSDISKRDIGESFWHEKNGLDMVEKIELLEDPNGNKQNLNLTYAVRDGIISHCGEIDENKLKPRSEFIDLKEYTQPNQYAPYTWEGCVVKIADKISYLGRDIADAITLGILNKDLDELYSIISHNSNEKINNTVIINDLIFDLCNNSSPEEGLCFSNEMFNTINSLKKFNYQKIYLSDKLIESTYYFKLVLNSIYDLLKESFNNKEKTRKVCPELINDFENWLKDYQNMERHINNKNDVIFNIENEKDYYKAIIYYISGMTDNYAMEMYNRIIGF
jgi:dGTPase